MDKTRWEQVKISWAVAALLLAGVIFTLLFTAYARRFDRAMTEENRSRLEEVSSYMVTGLEQSVEQQWKQLYVAAEASSTIPDVEERILYLGEMAERLNFEYIGLAGDDGVLYATVFHQPQDISGKDFYIAAREGKPYMTGLELHILWDRAISGVVLSIPASGEPGSAVVAMLGTTKLGDNIESNSFGGNGISYIIDAEGNLLLRSRSMAYNNLFQALQNLKFEEGYSLELMRADIEAQRSGMTAYSDLGVDKYAYYRPLRFNDWTMVCIVPKDVVTTRTSALSHELIFICAAATLVFLGLLSVVGFLLLRLESRRRANRAKSDFMANMSHDMRTPMNAVIGMTAIAKAHADEPDTIRDCMKKIDSSSRHLLGLINDVLDMSRIESGKMTLDQEPFSLAELLESVENMTYPRMHDKGQRFDLRLHNIRNEFFLGDSLRLGQVFVNILTNATKFTPSDGLITVDVEELSQEEPGRAMFRFTFTDNGIGMNAEFLKKIYNPFTQERSNRSDNNEGSGLGMSITKQIVDLMGGRIEVRSTEGEGSIFIVTLPLLLDSTIEETDLPPAWNVLLVGGHEGQGAETVNILKSMGLYADWVKTVGAAVKRLDEGGYHGIFLDYDAYSVEAVAALQGVEHHGVVLFLTAYNWENIRDESLRAGVRYFVQKPLLRSTICRALRKAAGLEAEEISSSQLVPKLTGKRILLAEDNLINMEIAETMLSEAGAIISCTHDGLECVEKFRTSPAGCFDLILMDIQMPRMNGYEAAARIRAMERDDASLPILAMSANAYAEDIAAAFAAGMNGYLTKPIDMAVWMERILKFF